MFRLTAPHHTYLCMETTHAHQSVCLSVCTRVFITSDEISLHSLYDEAMSPDQPAVVDTTRTAQTVATATTAATATGGQCADLISHCSEYGKDDCGTYSDFMSHYCPRYCGNCTPDSGSYLTGDRTTENTFIMPWFPFQNKKKLLVSQKVVF